MPLWLQILFGIIGASGTILGIVLSIYFNKRKKQLANKIEIINNTVQNNGTNGTNNTLIKFENTNMSNGVVQFYTSNINTIIKEAAAAKSLNDLQIKINENKSWATIFYENAKHVDDDEIRKIWSKILCDDDYSSFRLLNCLGNMTKESAEKFKEILSHVMDNGIIVMENRKERNFKDLFLLRDINLIDLGPFLRFQKLLKPHIQAKVFMSSELVCVAINETENDFLFEIGDIYRLTDIGIELSKYVTYSNMSQDEFLKIATAIKKQNIENKIRISVFKILYFDGNIVHYDENDLLLNKI